MRIPRVAASVVVVLALVSGASAALDIVVSFDNSAAGTWSTVQKAVVNQAIADWENAFAAYDLNATVNFGIDFRNMGGGIAATTYGWVWGGVPAYDASTRPWLGTGHYMGVTPSGLWWDPTPQTDGDVGGYDALSIIRHELGHMLGSTPGFYFDHYNAPGHTDVWNSRISGNVFDPGGLNVPMQSSHEHTTSGLMKPVFYPGERYNVQDTMMMFALAYDLQPVPEPMTMTLLALGGLALLKRRR